MSKYWFLSKEHKRQIMENRKNIVNDVVSIAVYVVVILTLFYFLSQ